MSRPPTYLDDPKAEARRIAALPPRDQRGIYVDTGAQELRHAVENLGSCREDFLDAYSAEQLLRIHRMWMASRFDIRPDCWTERQVREALRGVAPDWDESTDQPVYRKGAA